MIKYVSNWSSRSLLLAICLVCLGNILAAQEDTIRLRNPSFESIPLAGTTPSGWYDCGTIDHPSETPPDVHPNPIRPSFGVITPANDGETYIGLVVRDNDTWESVSQRLSTPMRAGNCYTFSLYLARSSNYLSAVGDRDSNVDVQREETDMVNHNTPAALRIWGGNGYCDKTELLASTSEIPHERWIEYNYKFEPTRTMTYITLEAFYKTPTPFPYNGNLLIDNLSAIGLTPCQEETPEIAFSKPQKNYTKVSKPSYTFRAKTKSILSKEQLVIQLNNRLIEEFYFDSRTGGIAIPERLKKGKNTIVIRGKNSVGNVEVRCIVVYEEEEEIIAAVTPPPASKPMPTTPKESSLMKRSEIKAGKTIRLDKLYFQADSTRIEEPSYAALDEVYDFLVQNNDVVVEIGGHTNGVPPADWCLRFSKKRAQSVAEYLIQKGIAQNRLRYKGYGKSKPIASNKTMEGRRKNQRVEIKILSFDG